MGSDTKAIITAIAAGMIGVITTILATAVGIAGLAIPIAMLGGTRLGNIETELRTLQTDMQTSYNRAIDRMRTVQEPGKTSRTGPA